MDYLRFAMEDNINLFSIYICIFKKKLGWRNKNGVEKWSSVSLIFTCSAAPIAVVPPAFPFGSTPPQSVVPVRDFPQSFGSDSWKIPQQNLPSQPTSQPAQAGQQIQPTQLPFQVPVSGISQQQQPSPVFPGSAQAPFGGVPTSASLNAPSNQPQYQQLAPQQPPGFPPPLNLPPQTQQPQHQRVGLGLDSGKVGYYRKVLSSFIKHEYNAGFLMKNIPFTKLRNRDRDLILTWWMNGIRIGG